MPGKHSFRDQIIGKINDEMHKKVSGKMAKEADNFVEQYYSVVSEDDLKEFNPADLSGAVISSWEFLNERKPGEVKIRVFNPELKKDKWQNGNTIVEVIMDDHPFLVDSVRMTLIHKGFNVRLLISPPVLSVVRDEKGKLVSVDAAANEKNTNGKNAREINEAIVHAEIDQQLDQQVLDAIENELSHVLRDVELVVKDWQPMTEEANKVVQLLRSSHFNNTSTEECQEVIDFIDWLASGNFTFLGSCEYTLKHEGKFLNLEPQPKTGLGLLRDAGKLAKPEWLKDIPIKIESKVVSESLLLIRRLIHPSTVHRPTAPYSIGIRRVDENGKTIGKIRFVGLFTSAAYNSDVQAIPVLRLKVKHIIKRSALSLREHSGKELLNILATYPRDELFQADEDELYENVIGIMHMQERPRVRLFVRRDFGNRFFSCLVYVPREIFTSDLRYRMGEILMDAFKGSSVSFQTRVSESMLARIHFIILLPPDSPEIPYDTKALQDVLVQASRTWEDDLKDTLVEKAGDKDGRFLLNKYCRAFPAGYRETYSAPIAVFDIENLEILSEENPLGMSFYRSEENPKILNLKLYNVHHSLPLSDILPMLENMGLKVITEASYQINPSNGRPMWISDFAMQHPQTETIDVENVQQVFQEAFAQAWAGNIENDGFNKLVLNAGLTWRQVNVLRAYAKYFRQIGVAFSQTYIEQALAKHAAITGMLIDLFESYFNPEQKAVSEAKITEKSNAILHALDNVSSLDEDRILRRYLSVMAATMRTNFYQLTEEGNYKSYLSFKIKSALVPDMPLPLPLYEIFVYSPRVEGVHLRSSKVARGGLRWSDRQEDFRTEVLGLMKAQQVKNSIIVPAGAKGGFVCKRLPTDVNRDEVMKEVVSCYSTFISALLDITDNLDGEKVIPPLRVVRRDDNDPYLVVAADKGTATFSDTANAIAAKYNFWLGDAFASGGSAGYDHKKMGITAKGAWVSVSRHFRELGMDVQAQDFTVVGVGDMSGDVFGNGMLLSKHIKLIAAFDHRHIFLDPDPDPQTSFKERKRMFDLPRSSWDDYDKKLISKGGGVFSRSEKSIKLSKEVQKALKISKESVVPTELVKAILTAPVDLLWNGGIGTYVKAFSERDADVGDRSNDAVRVNGKDLRCRVVGEGGNLGFTQLGRVEYSLRGGICYTDFVDNSGGVDCSDHEVNLKILLNSIVVANEMTEKQRNALLVDMTDEVSEQVLRDNYQQTQAISFAESRAKRTIDENIRFIDTMERWGRLDRALEFLPNAEQLAQRKANGIGLTRPEISILVAYAKMYLKEQLLNSVVPEDDYLTEKLHAEFLGNLGVKYAKYLDKHKLKRELISTHLANAICNEVGPTFITRLYDETGASAPEIARGFVVSREVFSLREIFDLIEALDYKVASNVQKQMMTDIIRLVRRGTRWFVRNRRLDLDIAALVAALKPQMVSLEKAIPKLVTGLDKTHLKRNLEHYMAAGVPEATALRVASANPMISALDIMEAADIGKLPLLQVAEAYFSIGERLKLDWFREELDKHLVANTWDALARAACKDDLDRQQRTITMAVMRYPAAKEDIHSRTEAWMVDHHAMIERWEMILSDLKTTKAKEFTMFTVALRELLDLAQASIRKIGKK